jgi:probable rRNA maturation factor
MKKKLSARGVKTNRRAWNIDVEIKSRKLGIPKRRITEITRMVLETVDPEIAPSFINSIFVQIIDDPEIAEINAAYRNKAKPTDVLSFPTFQPKEIRGARKVVDTFQNSLGDLIISSSTTLRQAVKYEVNPEDELERLLVHGVLHLCGYDHEGVPATEAQKMRRKEYKIRKALKDARVTATKRGAE